MLDVRCYRYEYDICRVYVAVSVCWVMHLCMLYINELQNSTCNCAHKEHQLARPTRKNLSTKRSRLRVLKLRVCSEWAALPHVPWDRCPLARDLSQYIEHIGHIADK